MSRSLLDKVIKLCESHGFSIESSFEGSPGRTCIYHFGPLGTEFRRNLRNAWWYDVVLSKANIYGFETNWFTNSAINGHVQTVRESSSALSDMNKEENQFNTFHEPGFVSDKCSVAEEHCWNSGDINNLTNLARFVPGIKVPFGVATQRKYICYPAEDEKYILRSCEKEVMNLQFFCAENRLNDWLNHWKRQRLVWWRKFANVRSNYRPYEEQLSSLEPGLNSQTFVQYAFPWGQETVDSLTVRCDVHKHLPTEQNSRLPFSKDLKPHVIQIKTDLNRGFLSFLMDAYLEKARSDSSGNESMRTVLHLHPQLAPIKVAVLPQNPQQSELCDVACQLSSELQEAGISTQCSLHVYNNADECYAYQDEIGTPYCVTILDTTLNNGIVMFRSRNTTLHEFMHVSDILSTVKKHLGLNSSMWTFGFPG